MSVFTSKYPKSAASFVATDKPAPLMKYTQLLRGDYFRIVNDRNGNGNICLRTDEGYVDLRTGYHFGATKWATNPSSEVVRVDVSTVYSDSEDQT